jgi:hypothetical protein
MTDPEMNAFSIRKLKVPLATGAVAALGFSLSGCALGFDPATDAASPLAPRVQQLVDANREYPRWENFPAAPAGLPAPVEVATRVNTLRATQGALAAEIAANPQILEDPAAFEAETRARVEAVPVSPDSIRTLSDIDEFARRQRARAAAPPPIDRHPPRP